jgi:hypothetical protein
MIVSCGSCFTELTPANSGKCSKCESTDIVVGMFAPNGARVSGPRDAPRIRIRARRGEDPDVTEWEAIVGPAPRPKGLARYSEQRPYLQMCSDIRWNHDRQSLERRELYIDRENNCYRQEWFSRDTGETTFPAKEGPLDDPNLHGRSARRGPSA